MRLHPLIPLLIFFLTQSVLSKEFHVSTAGDDYYSGSEEKPFLTLTRARDEVRRINKSMTEDIIVFLHGGEYTLKEPVTFNELDSGSNGHKVIYRAYKKEVPIISGGVKLNHWDLFKKDRNIYRSHLSVEPFRQIFINGSPAIRARTPNLESTTTLCPCWSFVIDEIPKVKIKKEYWHVIDDVPKVQIGYVEMVMVSQWYHQRIHIGKTSFKDGYAEITPRNPKGKFLKSISFYNKEQSNSFYFENALDFIDSPKEWYYDLNSKFLYLELPFDVNPEVVSIFVPLSETLIDVQGLTKKPVHDIEFQDLTFQYTNWNSPSFKGVNMTQAAQVEDGKQPSPMFNSKHVRRLGLRNNTFKNAGGHGIKLFNVDDSDIEGNLFNNISANCIDIDSGGGRNPSPEKQSTNIAIWNNVGSKCGNQYSNGIFLMTNNVRDLTVAHNVIHDMPYSGMQIGQQPGIMRNVGSGNNLIIYNKIYDANQIHGDGGGIYTLGGIQKGTIISENFIHDINQPEGHYKVNSVYLDNFTSEILVENNVISGGSVAERNGSRGNIFLNNVQCNIEIERNSGVKIGYNPRKEKRENFSTREQKIAMSDVCE
jgi:hypothetical protein